MLINNRVFPMHFTKEDYIFYRRTIGLSFVKTSYLGINDNLVNEHLWEIAMSHIIKINEEKCPVDKLRCVQRAYSILNNTIKFCSGKKEGAGVDDIMPILIYLIIKTKPKRMISNLNYIKSLVQPSKLLQNQGFLLTQLEMCIEFIININYKTFKINEQEFIKKYANSLENYVEDNSTTKKKKKKNKFHYRRHSSKEVNTINPDNIIEYKNENFNKNKKDILLIINDIEENSIKQEKSNSDIDKLLDTFKNFSDIK